MAPNPPQSTTHHTAAIIPSHPLDAAEQFGNIVFLFLSGSCGQRVGVGSRRDGGCVRPILWDTPTHGRIFTIYIRLFCTANVAVIAAITAKLQFFVSCKIAAISAFLQQTVKAEITACLISATRVLALAVSDFKAKECGDFFRRPLVERLFRAELV